MNDIDSPAHGFSHGVFEFREELFDRIEVGAVRRQEDEFRSGPADHGTDFLALVAAEVVEHDDVTGLERPDQFGLDIGFESLAIDRSVQHPWRIDPVAAQGRDEGHRLPVSMRDMRDEPLAAVAPASQRGHVGLDPGLVEEDQATGVYLVAAATGHDAAPVWGA